MWPRTILFPTDFSASVAAALATAQHLALPGGRLVILHVVDSLGPEAATYAEAMTQPQPEGVRRRLWADFRRRLGSLDGTAELVLGEGDPAPAIVRAAVARPCDLIVLVCAGHRCLWDRLFPGTVQRVLESAPCPVLVVGRSGRPAFPQVQLTELHPGFLSVDAADPEREFRVWPGAINPRTANGEVSCLPTNEPSSSSSRAICTSPRPVGTTTASPSGWSSKSTG